MNRLLESTQQYLHNVRLACRHVFAKRGFAAIAIVTLALGIGANTAVFSVIDAVLLHALPFPAPDRLVVLDEVRRQHGSRTVSWLDFQDWLQQCRSFDAMAAYRTGTATLTGTDQPVLLHTADVSASFFPILKLAPSKGRVFGAEDDKPGAPRTVVVSDGFWRTQLGGKPDIVGMALVIDGSSYEVVGVLPPSFHFFTGTVDVYLPVGLRGAEPEWNRRGMHPDLLVLARLKAGTELNSARADMTAIMDRLEVTYPQSNAGLTATVTTLYQHYFGRMQTILFTIFASVGCVLLMACANVANLLLERGTARRKEMAIRAALGADRRRLLTQLVTESMVLSLSGGTLGVGVAALSLFGFAIAAPSTYAQFASAHINGTVLLFTLAISIVIAAVFGALPAIQACRVDLNEAFNHGSQRAGEGRQARRIRSGLLAIEIGLALVVATAAGLMARSLWRALAVDLGFAPEHLVAMDITIPTTRYSTAADKTLLVTQAVERLRGLAGVQAAGAVLCAPIARVCGNNGFMLADHPIASVVDLPTAVLNFVAPGYFETARIPLASGRYFTASDDLQSRNVAIVSNAFARQNWPMTSAIGKMIREGGPNGNQPYREIVGVVADVRQSGVESEGVPEVFLPVTQFPFAPWDSLDSMTFLVRANDPAIAERATEAVRAKDKDLLVTAVRAVSQDVDGSLARRRFVTWLFGSFSMLALALGGIGTYGVMSYGVSQREREIGTRMALGATRSAIWKMVLRETLTLAATGVVLGLLVTQAASRWIGSLLFGVGANDLLTFSAAAAILVFVAIIATWVPIRRATRVNPAVALRSE